MQSVSKNPLIATFQLSSAASSNLGQSENGMVGNGLNPVCCNCCLYTFLYIYFFYILGVEKLVFTSLCPRIKISGEYCFNVVRPSVCLCRLNVKTYYFPLKLLI